MGRLAVTTLLLLGLGLSGCHSGAHRRGAVLTCNAGDWHAHRANLVFTSHPDDLEVGQKLAARTDWPAAERGYVFDDESSALIVSVDNQGGFGGYGGDGGYGYGYGAFGCDPSLSGLGGYGLWGYPGPYSGFSPYGYGSYPGNGYLRQSETSRSYSIRR